MTPDTDERTGMVTEEMVKAAARAMCIARGIDPNEPTFATGASNGDYIVHERQVDRYIEPARAALSAALAIPDAKPVGWYRGNDWTLHFKLGPDKPENSTSAEYEWKPLYASPVSSELEEEVKRLREALEPFAAEADARANLVLGPDIDHWPIGGSALTFGHLRRARAALNPQGQGEGK
jgi:hypothetical protein